jgi:predicted MPP superfamily phosphohydrolase
VEQIKRQRFHKRYVAVAVMLMLALGCGKAWADTMGRPSVERTSLAVAGLPAGSPPIRIALISDIHMAGPDMPPERVAEIVAQINALRPDLVAIAGDLVSDKRTATHIYTPEQIVAPLGKLQSRLGTFVVPGNHDHWFDMPGLTRELQANGITLLANDAVQVGPLVIGGMDDAYTHRANVRATLAAMDRFSGARIMLSHSPDPFPRMPRSVPLMLAGHTHCGRIDENGKVLVVGAGLGTSLIPLRLFTQPTIWLVELRGE